MDEFPGEADVVLVLGEPVAQTHLDPSWRSGVSSWQRHFHSEEGGYMNKIRIPAVSRRRLGRVGRILPSTGSVYCWSGQRTAWKESRKRVSRQQNTIYQGSLGEDSGRE